LTPYLRRAIVLDGSKGRETMREIKESYRRIGDETDRFDVEFWQAQGDQAIFDAALDMILDYLTLRNGHAEEPRLQRTVEHFGKLEL
jgi:hypothetical protein